MSYIDLIRKFWQLDATWQFGCCESRLYFYLVEQANRLGWPNSFTHSDRRLSENVGASRNAISRAKNRLEQAGLLHIITGGRGKGNRTAFSFVEEPNPESGIVSNGSIGLNMSQNMSQKRSQKRSQNEGDTSCIEDRLDKNNITPYNPPNGETVVLPPFSEKAEVTDSSNTHPQFRGTPSREFLEFQQWISENAPRVAKMKEPFSEAQFSALKEAYALDFICDLLRAMHNYEPLLKRNRSAYLTFLNWARRRNETSLPRSNTRHPATTYHAKPTQHYDEF